MVMIQKRTTRPILAGADSAATAGAATRFTSPHVRERKVSVATREGTASRIVLLTRSFQDAYAHWGIAPSDWAKVRRLGVERCNSGAMTSPALAWMLLSITACNRLDWMNPRRFCMGRFW